MISCPKQVSYRPLVLLTVVLPPSASTSTRERTIRAHRGHLRDVLEAAALEGWTAQVEVANELLADQNIVIKVQQGYRLAGYYQRIGQIAARRPPTSAGLPSRSCRW